MKTTLNLFLLFLASLLLATSGIARSPGVAPVDYSQYGRPPVPVRVLLLIPGEFQLFEYVSTYEGKEILHTLGEDGTAELRAAFGIEFASVELWQVRNEAEAMEMLVPTDPANLDVRAFNYVVIPKFMRVDSSVKNQKYDFDIDLLTEFYARDGGIVTKIKGHGESSTGNGSHRHRRMVPGLQCNTQSLPFLTGLKIIEVFLSTDLFL